MFLLEAVELGWVGGAGISGASIVTALVVLWKRSEATNKALIDVHKQRADEAEARTKEITQVLRHNGDAMQAYTQAIERHADSEVIMAEAVDSLALACKAFAERDRR